MAAVVAAGSASAAVTVGLGDTGVCDPFMCAPTANISEFQEEYFSSDFSGPISFNTISFTEGQIPKYGNGYMDTGEYTVAFYLTNGLGTMNPLLGEGGSLADNEGKLLGEFGTFDVSGKAPAIFSLTGNSITYDPSQGGLLMDVIVDSGTSYNHESNVAYLGDQEESQVATAFEQLGPYGGAYSPERNGLQTTFSLTAVPEPSAWALLMLGVGAIGVACRRRRVFAAA